MKSKNRTFSTSFKKEKVELIEKGKLSVRDVSALYQVSTTAVYKWLKKYSKLPKDERIVVEKISEEQKNKDLLKMIQNLECSLGRKQLELDYYKTIVDLVSEDTGEDIKKKYKPEL
jgi:transposase-like protein